MLRLVEILSPVVRQPRQLPYGGVNSRDLPRLGLCVIKRTGHVLELFEDV